MSNGPNGLYEFGPYRLDTSERVFSRHGRNVTLAPKTFELLLLLVRSPRRALSKQELMAALWPDTFVEEANLSFQISVLRKALGRDARLIETVPKHGYRFAADVYPVSDHASPASAGDATAGKTVPTPRVSARRLAIIIIAASVLLAASYLSTVRRPSVEVEPPAIPVPLTTYPGFEGVPTLSPDGSLVAFTWDGPNRDNSDIYVRLVGTGEPVRLTQDPAWDFSPSWSPDGGSIAFERFITGGREVFVIPALGGAQRRVATIQEAQTGLRSNLTWSPDGKWIVVGGRPSGETSTGIWLIAEDGSEKRQLTAIGELDAGDTNPAFSPEGRHLAFIRARKNSSNAIHILELSSTLTAVGRPFQISSEHWHMLGLAWSPDGKSLVFSSGPHSGIPRLQRIALRSTSSPSSPELLSFGEQSTAVTISRTGRLVYATQSRDSNLWRLPLGAGSGRAPELVASSTYDEHTPDYSRDGKRLAFTSTRSGVEEIWIANADGSKPEQVTSMKGPLCANPRWSPLGNIILFSSRAAGSQDLYLLPLDSGDPRRITDHPSEEVEPRWSRDGQWIYFGSNRTGRPELWRMPAAGGAHVQITQHGGLTGTESLDRRFLYYAKHGGSPTSIWRVPVEGGEEKLVVDGVSNSLNFVVADRGLYFLAVGHAVPAPPAQVFHRERQSTSIEFYEFASGKRTVVLAVGKQAWAGMALAPDQQSLLYSVIDSAGGNLMLVERFN